MPVFKNFRTREKALPQGKTKCTDYACASVGKYVVHGRPWCGVHDPFRQSRNREVKTYWVGGVMQPRDLDLFVVEAHEMPLVEIPNGSRSRIKTVTFAPARHVITNPKLLVFWNNADYRVIGTSKLEAVIGVRRKLDDEYDTLKRKMDRLAQRRDLVHVVERELRAMT